VRLGIGTETVSIHNIRGGGTWGDSPHLKSHAIWNPRASLFRSRAIKPKGPPWSLFRSLRHSTPMGTFDSGVKLSTLEYIGRRGLSLSGSYQQGYSTAYNTRSHITVVYNGYILAHISNWNPRGTRRTLPCAGRSPPCMIHGQRPICILVKCARVSIVTFWHGF
jgi:hypothetical protein